MLDNLLLTEVLAEQKRRDIEGRILNARLVEIAAAGQTRSSGLRGTVAEAIVRFGILLDDTAGRRAAAPQH